VRIAQRYLLPHQLKETDQPAEQITITPEASRRITSRYKGLYVEGALLLHDKGLRLTGQLDEAMKESARTAQSFVWLHADTRGIDPNLLRHVPSPSLYRHRWPVCRM
jgi:ATP-dependent Lon protease